MAGGAAWAVNKQPTFAHTIAGEGHALFAVDGYGFVIAARWLEPRPRLLIGYGR
jgi:hypothetical protein